MFTSTNNSNVVFTDVRPGQDLAMLACLHDEAERQHASRLAGMAASLAVWNFQEDLHLWAVQQ